MCGFKGKHLHLRVKAWSFYQDLIETREQPSGGVLPKFLSRNWMEGEWNLLLNSGLEAVV